MPLNQTLHGGGMTQQQVASALGIDRSRVGQIERRALRKMRRALLLDAHHEAMRIGEYFSTDTLDARAERSIVRQYQTRLEA